MLSTQGRCRWHSLQHHRACHLDSMSLVQKYWLSSRANNLNGEEDSQVLYLSLKVLGFCCWDLAIKSLDTASLWSQMSMCVQHMLCTTHFPSVHLLLQPMLHEELLTNTQSTSPQLHPSFSALGLGWCLQEPSRHSDINLSFRELARHGTTDYKWKWKVCSILSIPQASNPEVHLHAL